MKCDVFVQYLHGLEQRPLPVREAEHAVITLHIRVPEMNARRLCHAAHIEASKSTVGFIHPVFLSIVIFVFQAVCQRISQII
jgi:hypothetical protein